MSKKLIDPRGLKAGDEVVVYRFNDKNDLFIPRHGVILSIDHLGYRIRFNKGYIECWQARNLLYALNGRSVPDGYNFDEHKANEYLKQSGRIGKGRKHDGDSEL